MPAKKPGIVTLLGDADENEAEFVDSQGVHSVLVRFVLQTSGHTAHLGASYTPHFQSNTATPFHRGTVALLRRFMG